MTARLPDLVVIGAPKAGTTTLAGWLAAHPQVAFSAAKELEFFDQHWDRGVEWYRSQLPAEPGDRLVAEATPTYLSEPGVAERVAATLPQARFVAVLREPVARAWSQYWFFRQLGLESRTWERAVAADTPGDRWGYLWRGRYAEQLERWYATVGRERVQVVLFEDLIGQPGPTYAGICRFAGIDEAAPPGTESVNPTRRPHWDWLQRRLVSPTAGPLRRKLYAWNGAGAPIEALPAQERARLAPRFRDQNARLARLLDRELPASWSS